LRLPGACDVEIGCEAVMQACKPELRIMRDERTDHEWAAIKPMLPNPDKVIDAKIAADVKG
jgi:hypothetical protein